MPYGHRVSGKNLTKAFGNSIGSQTKAYQRFSILKAESGQEALKLVKKLKLRNGILALLLADQRMPQMSGISLLEEVMHIFPEAKRDIVLQSGNYFFIVIVNVIYLNAPLCLIETPVTCTQNSNYTFRVNFIFCLRWYLGSAECLCRLYEGHFNRY